MATRVTRSSRKRKADDGHPESSSSKLLSKTTSKPSSSSKYPVYHHWLFKSEPLSRMEKGMDMKFSFDDLKKEPDSTTGWDGVRNYQARNYMMSMHKNDEAFFYHSNCSPPGIIGLVRVASEEAYVDPTQFDAKDPHYDPKSSREKPKWFHVDIQYVRPLKRFISLHQLKKIHLEHKKMGKGALKNVALFTSARLSVQPLTLEEFDFILNLENEQAEESH